MKTDSQESSLVQYLHPKYAATWCGLAILFIVSKLPFTWLQSISTCLGYVAYRFGRTRREVASANIRECFPHLSRQEQDELVKNAFVANMKGIFESAVAWWGNPEKILQKLDVYGLEYIREAESRGKGVLLLGGHFSLLDFAAPMISNVIDFNYMYRPNDNKLFNAVIERGRKKFSNKKFTKFETLEMLKYLKDGNTVWYGYDQDFGAKRSVFAPFFNVPAATLKMPRSIARKTGATVLMLAQLREPNGRYSLRFSPIFEDFSALDDTAAATQINAQLEAFVKLYPEQYLWMHRRFRTRPIGLPPIYVKE